MIGRRLLLWLFGAAAVAPVAVRARAATPPFPFVLIHRKCGRPAFYLRCEIERGDEMLSADVALLDGNPLPPFTAVVCGSCGGGFIPSVNDIRAT